MENIKRGQWSLPIGRANLGGHMGCETCTRYRVIIALRSMQIYEFNINYLFTYRCFIYSMLSRQYERTERYKIHCVCVREQPLVYIIIIIMHVVDKNISDV